MSSHWLGEARSSLEKVWRQMPARASFFSEMKAITRTYRNFYKKKAQEARAEESALRKQLELSTTALQESPNDLDIQRRHSLTRQQLQALESRKVRGKQIRARIRWKVKGGSPSVEFFWAVREKAASTAITGLRDSTGTIQSDPTGLGRVCSEYFRNLYAVPNPVEDPAAAMHDFSSLLGDRFDSKAKERLHSPLSEQELRATTFAMAKDKSPGPDGVIIEFYTTLWDLIGQEFSQMVLAPA
jgi:hypothetical protein